MRKLLLVLLIALSFSFCYAQVFAAPLNYSWDTSLSLSQPQQWLGSLPVIFIVQSGSVADNVVVNAGSAVVTMSSTTGGNFTLISSSSQVLVQTTGSGGAATTTCIGTAAQLVISQASGSSTYTITPTLSACGPSYTSGSSSSLSVYTAPGAATLNPLPPAPTSQIQSSGGGSALRFTKNLRAGMIDPQVKQLQQFLNTRGFTVAASGPGSPGQETTKFGALTFKAVIRFQNAYAKQILVPNNLKSGNGYFGPSTRAVANQILFGN